MLYSIICIINLIVLLSIIKLRIKKPATKKKVKPFFLFKTQKKIKTRTYPTLKSYKF